jgi:DNA topoisomerase-1
MGLITYHRTDSTTLSDKALNESARVIKEMFGGEYYEGPRRYQTRVKNAQEAHEAIRPAAFNLAPSQIERALDPDDFKLYDLIWKRTMASQMVDARVLRTTIEFTAKGANGEAAVFSASGKAIEFAGFRRAYVEGSDDPAAELEEQESILPQCKVGDRVDRDGTAVTLVDTEPKRHDTTPPARFTEASLIKELERLGIGRPSTYAPTIATIVRAATCSGRTRRSSPASRPLPSRNCCGITSATSSRATLPPRWKRTSTRSREASVR